MIEEKKKRKKKCAATIVDKNIGTNDKFYRKVAFLMYTVILRVIPPIWVKIFRRLNVSSKSKNFVTFH